MAQIYESEMLPARDQNCKLCRVLGKRPRESCLSEKKLVAEKRVMKEMAAMKKCMPSFVSIQFPTGFLDWRRFDVVISLVGEIISSDCYGGKSYRFAFRITEEYPTVPPLVECMTPVFHPNIGYDGSVGLRVLRADWLPTDTIEGIIFKLHRLFFHPCNEDTCVVNQDAAQLYRRRPTDFKYLVGRVATQQYSKPSSS